MKTASLPAVVDRARARAHGVALDELVRHIQNATRLSEAEALAWIGYFESRGEISLDLDRAIGETDDDGWFDPGPTSIGELKARPCKRFFRKLEADRELEERKRERRGVAPC